MKMRKLKIRQTLQGDKTITATPVSAPFMWLMWPMLISLIFALSACAGSATRSVPGEDELPERNFNAPSLQVDTHSKAREIFADIPQESLMERFVTYDNAGRLIGYVAFTDTSVGGLVFIDGKLHGSISRRDAQAFYICRGHVMAAGKRYWASEADVWVTTLLAQVRAETSLLLEFSGRSTMQSIKSATENPLLGGLKTIIGMGTNPFRVFSTLNAARDQYQASEQFAAEEKGFGELLPGMSEQRLTQVARPQDLLFVENNQGMVLSYPSHRVDFFMADGSIRVIQQPSFYFLSRTNAALFYAPGMNWSACNAAHWPQALPVAAARKLDEITDNAATQTADTQAAVKY